MIRQTLTIAASALLTFAWQPISVGEIEWTGWLGPKRNGWVEGFQPPTQWPEQLQLVWRAQVGSGYGTPLVSNGRVYQHARQGEEEVLLCLSLKTGDTIWRQTYGTPFKMGGGGERHGKGPKSNPSLADGRIFTMSITGVLSAFDASSGSMLWQKNYGPEFNRPHPNWGASTSPLVDGNKVVVHFGGDDEGVLVALNAETGNEAWRSGEDGASYSSPFFGEFFGTRQIVEWNHNDLVGIDPDTGKELWAYPLPHLGSNQNMPTPTYHAGCVIVGGENRGIRSIRPVLENGVWRVEERWHQKNLALDMSSAVINGNHLYGFSHYRMGQLFCLDTDTGQIIWEGPGRSGDNATFLAIPNHILALLDKGELQVLEANGKEFKKIVSYSVADSPTWAAPVLLNNGILVKDRDSLTLWSLNLDRAE